MNPARIDSPAAFEAVFREHYQALARFAFRFVGDVGAAEDVVQDVFAHLWAERHSIRPTSSLRAYLYAAVRNRALNVVRRESVASGLEAVHEGLESLSSAHSPTRPDDRLDAVELSVRLAAAFATLPEKQATAMRLRWRDALSYAEIAEVLGISVKGVEKHLSRGLASLREQLGQER